MMTMSAGWIDRDERHIQIKDIINKAFSSLLLQYSSNINNSPPMMTKSAGWIAEMKDIFK